MALSRIVAMAMGLAGALGASQGPEFAQQYTQRLGGAIDELETVVARFDAGAAESGLGRDDAMERLERNVDALVRSQGAQARLAAQRLEDLRAQRARLAQASDFDRVITLLRDADPQIARGAYLDYKPAVPVTSEGFLAAGIGFALFWLLGFGGSKSAAFAGRKSMTMVRGRLAKSRSGAGPGAAPKAPAEPRVHRRGE